MEEWNCKVCTFLNHGLLDSCEICGTKKCIPSPRTNQDTKCIIQDQSNVSTSMKRKDDSIQVGRTLGSPSSSLQYSGKIFKTNSQTLQYFIPFSCSHILISAFCFDYEWLLGSVLPRNKPTTLIVHNPQESSSLQPSQVINDGYITRIIPKRPRGRCCMHSKFILIWTADYLRFIITTANMLDFDFDGRVENLLFVQDFKVGSQIANDNFRSGLVTMLKDHSVTDSIIKKLDGIDFSTAKCRLVTSIPGVYKSGDPNYEKYGVPALASAIKDLVPDFIPSSIECQTSSMGSLSIPWLSNFFDAACGKLPSFKSIEPPIKVIYPSKSYVEASISGGGTIFFTRNYWFNQSFPKQLIYKYVSKTPRGVSHAKIIAAKDSKEDIKWAYIGSHNFTSSAWGNMASLKTCSKLTITNYETGLVFLYNEADHEDLVQYQKPQVFTRSDMPWSQTFD